jgi:hypothetical protein
MPMDDDQAATIAIACVKSVGGQTQVSMDDQLGSVGVGSTGLIDSLVDKICNNSTIGVPSAGFQIKPGEFGSIKTTSIMVNVANVIAVKAKPNG